jgi:hypothetical protein
MPPVVRIYGRSRDIPIMDGCRQYPQQISYLRNPRKIVGHALCCAFISIPGLYPACGRSVPRLVGGFYPYHWHAFDTLSRTENF